MEILTFIISIFAITGLVWLFNKVSPLKICPICAGVSGTWLWILAGIYLSLLDVGSWSPIAAIAMGGSVVGIAYQLEKRLPHNRSPFLWKTLFIPVGFLAIYSIISSWWGVAALTLLWLLGVTAVFLRAPIHVRGENKKVKELEKRMEECC